MTLAELARQAGIDYSYAWKIETGRSKASISTIEAMASALNVESSALFASP